MRIWPWSVIADLRSEIEKDDQHIAKLEATIDTQRTLLSQQSWVIQNGVGRILAKLDPLFAMPEDDPRRIADSKRLEEEIIKKLQAEHEVLRSRNLLP